MPKNLKLEEQVKKEIGGRITKARIQRGFSQIELSRAIGKNSAAYLSFIEKGGRNISVIDLIKISNLLNVSVGFLVGETEMGTYKKEKELIIKTRDGLPVARFTVKF